jgi:CHAT domain-containing protein
LIVADPATRIDGLGRLPRAAAEGNAVRARLEGLGWKVQMLAGEDAAHNDVVAALARVGWLHYAGHGIQAGHSGWQSALPLAGEARLDVPDILNAPRVPPSIVLSACDTGGTASSRGASMQLATAFLLAGAQFVVAAQDEVSDESAQRFSAALYGAVEGAVEGDLRGPELVHRAVVALKSTGEPMSTWAGFQVWVR